jgi:hypothetical protein
LNAASRNMFQTLEKITCAGSSAFRGGLMTRLVGIIIAMPMQKTL